MKRWFGLVLPALLLIPFTAAAREALTGPLAEYVAAPDASYQWVKRSEGSVATCKYVELTLTSQTWRGIVWRHQLFLIKPAQINPQSKHALLLIGGGNWKEELADPKTQLKLPGEAQLLALAAEQLKTPVAILLHVPQQPIFDGKREDEIISLTFREFLKSGDDQWPLLSPMVKSAVRAMDATQEAAKKEWNVDVEKFTVTGASKRGWTTWLTGAVDDRAVAIAPMVIDMLNMSQHMTLQKSVYGDGGSEQINDYEGLDEHINTPRGQALRKIVDPWEYRSRLTQPKLVILGTNDRYWPLDACNLYWDGLEGEKYLIYVPNNGHGLPDRSRVIAGLNAIHQRVITGKPLPKLSWSYLDAEDGVRLKIGSDTEVGRLRVWTTAAATRDFRESKWTELKLDMRGKEFNVLLPRPESALSAYFGELVFHPGEDTEFSLSTNVRIVPSKTAAAEGK